MDDKNPHWESTKYSQKVYWKGGVACGRDDDPDRVELMPPHARWPVVDFAWPRQRHDLERVERLLEVAYNRGQTDRSVEIAKMMKSLISL